MPNSKLRNKSGSKQDSLRRSFERRCKITANNSQRGMAGVEGTAKVYYVEEIVAKRVDEDELIEYSVKWWGWKSEDNTWEPKSKLMEDCPVKVLEFELESGGSTSDNQLKLDYAIALAEKDDGKPEKYQVEKILGKREQNGVVKYFVSWKELNSDFNCWESSKYLKDKYPELVKEFQGESKNSSRSPQEEEAPIAPCSTPVELTDGESPMDIGESASGGEDSEEVSLRNIDEYIPATEEECRRDILARYLQAETILGATLKNDVVYFLIKWKDKNEANLVPSPVANEMWPQHVIRFYEDRACWDAVDQEGVDENPSSEDDD